MKDQKRVEIVGTAEIAEMFGVTKQVVVNWKSRYTDFPAPIANLAMGAIFLKDHVKKWGKTNGKL